MNSNWSIKLQVGNGGVDGYNEFELVYKASTQERHKLTQMGSIRGQAPVILQHRSDSQAGVPARAVEENKTGEWQLSILDDDNVTPEWDTILNNVSRLNRLYSGATSTAVRNAMYGTAERVRIAILPEGATNTTYHDIQWGHADTSSVYYEKVSQQADNTKTARGAWFIPIKFTFKDSGYGASFELRNDLPSSPHFVEDSNSDGLADGWNPQGVATLALSTTEYLIGGQSQQVTATTGNRGVTSYEFPTNGNTKVVTYAWIYVVSGNVVFTLYDNTAGVTVRSVAVSVANSDRQAKSLTGNTWLRIPILETGLNAANNFRLLVASSGGAAVFYVDGAYVQFGDISTAPDGWCSSSQLKNRYDPTSTSAATQQQINYLDVWGIPGDLPATVKTIARPTTGKSSLYTAFKFSDGNNLASNIPYWQESDDYDVGTSTWSTGTGTTANHYFRLASGTASGSLTKAVDWEYFTKRPVRLFAAIRASTTAATISFQVNTNSIFSISGYTTLFQSKNASVDVVNGWELHDFGLINLTDITEVGQSKNLYLDLTATNSGSNTFDFDFAIVAPISEIDSFVISKTNIGLPAATNIPGLLIDGENKIVRRAEDYFVQPYQGAFWTLYPGITNRMVFIETAQNTATDYTEIDIDTDPVLTLTVTPRTQHLLGTS